MGNGGHGKSRSSSGDRTIVHALVYSRLPAQRVETRFQVAQGRLMSRVSRTGVEVTQANTILWRRIDLPGHEVGRLRRRDDGWELSGTAVFSHEYGPSNLHYLVICSSDWRTESAQVGGVIGDREIDLRVSVDSEGKWSLNGVAWPAGAGLRDIYLCFNP